MTPAPKPAIRIGYPCLNRSIGALADRTFRLASYTDDRARQTATQNLEALERLVRFNAEEDLKFVRISSHTVPFASHPICAFDWAAELGPLLTKIGSTLQKGGFRVSMHPDQFVLINSADDAIVKRSMAELEYHDRLLETMGLGRDAKIQIHVGGLYGDRRSAIERFARNFDRLSPACRSRLVIENDERLFGVRDCLEVHRLTGVPVLFDTFHHELKDDDLSTSEAFGLCARTWGAADRPPMIDYSSQAPGGRFGEHATSIVVEHLRTILKRLGGGPFDMMLEIKDKEVSALKAVRLLSEGAALADKASRKKSS